MKGKKVLFYIHSNNKPIEVIGTILDKYRITNKYKIGNNLKQKSIDKYLIEEEFRTQRNNGRNEFNRNCKGAYHYIEIENVTREATEHVINEILIN